MNHYRASILLFGLALPAAVILLLFGGCFLLRSKMNESLERNTLLFRAYEANRFKAIEIESRVANQRPHLDYWTKLLSEESSSAVNNHLRLLGETLPSKEYQKGGFERTSGSGGLGVASAQRSSQIRLAFRGTFRTMQQAFLDLESRLPQLQLQELRITPNPNSQNPTPLLNFQVTYTAWEN